MVSLSIIRYNKYTVRANYTPFDLRERCVFLRQQPVDKYIIIIRKINGELLTPSVCQWLETI